MTKAKSSSLPPTTTFFIRGTVDNEANVIQATQSLIDCLTASFGGGSGGGAAALIRPSLVSTQMEISPQHHTFIQGKNELLVKQVNASYFLMCHNPFCPLSEYYYIVSSTKA